MKIIQVCSGYPINLSNRNQWFFMVGIFMLSIRYIEPPKKLSKSIQNVNKIFDFKHRSMVFLDASSNAFDTLSWTLEQLSKSPGFVNRIIVFRTKISSRSGMFQVSISIRMSNFVTFSRFFYFRISMPVLLISAIWIIWLHKPQPAVNIINWYRPWKYVKTLNMEVCNESFTSHCRLHGISSGKFEKKYHPELWVYSPPI